MATRRQPTPSDHEPPADAPTGTQAPWDDPAWRDQVKHSAQEIWAAGMAAFAKAQAEGGKVFDAMVQEGMALQRKTQSAAESGLHETAQRLGAVADEVGQKAGQSWDRLETLFEGRTAKALSRLGVPTADQMAALEQRLAAVEAILAAGTAAPAATKAPRKRAAASPRKTQPR